MELARREPAAIFHAALVGHEMNDIAAGGQDLGQGLGREQMAAGATGGKHHHLTITTRRQLLHGVSLTSRRRCNRARRQHRLGTAPAHASTSPMANAVATSEEPP